MRNLPHDEFISYNVYYNNVDLDNLMFYVVEKGNNYREALLKSPWVLPEHLRNSASAKLNLENGNGTITLTLVNAKYANSGVYIFGIYSNGDTIRLFANVTLDVQGK